MRQIVATTKFKRDIKRVVRRKQTLEKLQQTINVLQRDSAIPFTLQPHKLRGEYTGCWECHLESDWLLIYSITSEVVTLYRTGSHTDLF